MGLVPKVALLFAVLFLLATGMLALQVTRKGNAVSKQRNLLDEPRHPVTEPMWQKARAVAGKPAPNFSLKNADGREVVLQDLAKERPVVIVFTKDDCPCSMEAQPLFNELAKAYAGKATFLAVIDSKPAEASKYRDDFRVPYDMVLADDGAVFKAFRAKQSVYTTLVAKGGLVVKQWPGYNRAMFVELDEELAKQTDSRPAPIDTSMAPEKMNSGCAFPSASD